nr:hypothetical protein [uncultured Cohaesibacter sp.]
MIKEHRGTTRPSTHLWRLALGSFFSDSEISLAELLQLDAQCASNHDVMPTVLVLLEEEVPAGTVALR